MIAFVINLKQSQDKSYSIVQVSRELLIDLWSNSR